MPEDLELLALFEPPQARLAYERWRDANRDLLTRIRDDAIRIDVGRTFDGDFYRVWVRRDFAPAAGKLKDMAAQHLLELMGESSERAYYAGRMRDLEFDLWDAVTAGPRTHGVIELDESLMTSPSSRAPRADGGSGTRSGTTLALSNSTSRSGSTPLAAASGLALTSTRVEDATRSSSLVA
jgi:hypothetical protein